MKRKNFSGRKQQRRVRVLERLTQKKEDLSEREQKEVAILEKRVSYVE